MDRAAVVICLSVLATLCACSGSGSAADATGGDLSPADAAVQPDAAPLATPSIDGQFDDWAGLGALATDPAGDASGGFDLTVVKATARGPKLYLYFEIGKELNAPAGLAADGTLLIDLALPGGRLTVDLRGRKAYTDGDPSKTLAWSEIDYVLAPTYASKRFELRVDLDRFGVKLGDTIKIDFGGADALDAPASLTIDQPADTPVARSPDREAGTSFRVASLNAWYDALHDPTRAVAAGRLVVAVAAEVYCFQELTSATATELASTLQTLDPHGDGATWNVQMRGHRAIASRASLVPLPLPSSTQAFAAAALELAGKKLVVFSVCTTCCGYIGSLEDQARIQQMSELAATIKKLRDGTLGAALDPWRDAPVVVVGDWNLVGSRKPLDLMLDPAGPALSHWQLRHLLVDDVFTWRADDPFPPGMLDLLVHSPTRLTRKNGYVLDTADLDAAALGALGLQDADSEVSDHLMLVADFQLD
jgi:hypothetical protein